MGIDATFDLLDPSSWSERRQKFDFDLSMTAWQVQVSPGAELRAFYGSSAAGAEGSNNLTGIADPVVNALIETVVSASSRDELVTAVRALDRVLRAQHLWIGAWYLGAHRVAIWDVFGRPAKPAPYDFNRGVPFWWLDQARYDALVEAGALR